MSDAARPDTLRALLRRGDRDAVWSIIVAQPRVVGVLLHATDDAEPEIREAALEALRDRPLRTADRGGECRLRDDPDAVYALLRRLEDDDATTVKSAAAIVREILSFEPAFEARTRKVTPHVTARWRGDPETSAALTRLVEAVVAALRGMALGRRMYVGSDEPGLEELAPHVMCPKRPDDVHGGPAMTTEEAWRESAPHGWLDNARRVFIGDTISADAGPSALAAGHAIRVSWGTKALGSAPPTLGAVRAVAADPAGFEASEALAREIARRCAPWGIDTPPTKIVWLIEPAPRAFAFVDAILFRQLIDEELGIGASRLHLGEEEDEARDPPRDRWRLDWLRLARHDLIRANAWRRAASDDTTVSDSLLTFERGKRIATFEDPFEPMMRLWRLGYALTTLTRDAIILTAPAVSVSG